MNDRPEWLIDDTAEIGESRIFAVHTTAPRLIGEMIPDGELSADELRQDIDGLTLSVNGWTLCRIEWIDGLPHYFQEVASSLCRSLREAMELHDSIRNILPDEDDDG